MVQPLTIENQGGSNNVVELIGRKNDNEEVTHRQGSCIKAALARVVSLTFYIVLHVLDMLVLVILLPIIIWEWITASDPLKVFLKAVVEVTLELLMWMILAGVSILMTATFILDDKCLRRSDHEKLLLLSDMRHESVSGDGNGSQYLEYKSNERTNKTNST